MSKVLLHPRGALIAAVAAAIALGLTMLVSAADARRQATTIGLIATMNAPSEVPAPTGDVAAARGAFTATASQDGTGAGLTWSMTFDGLTGPATAAHIHVAPRGQPGAVVVPLCAPCTSPASGTATIDAATLAAIQTGGAYVNVHTDRNRAGEIRGQLGIAAALRSALTSRQEVPKPKGNVRRATGAFVGAVTKEGTTGAVTWRLTFSRLTGPAVAAHIHIGRVGRAGPVAVALCGPCRTGQRGSAVVNAATLAALEAGRGYVNLPTRRNPGGEVRGQLPAAALKIG